MKEPIVFNYDDSKSDLENALIQGQEIPSIWIRHRALTPEECRMLLKGIDPTSK